MSSQVELCNMALGHCRAGSIQDIDESSTEAEYCKLYYDTALDFLLEDNPWKFTKVVEALALFSEEPLTWIYSYAYPTNCLQINEVIPNIDINTGNGNEIIYRNEYYNVNFDILKQYKVPYETALNSDGSQAIWTNEPDAYIAYTKRQTDPNMYSASFKLAFSHYLASLVAVSVTGEKKGGVIAESQLRIYQRMIDRAVMNNEIEKYRGAPRESDMITVRQT